MAIGSVLLQPQRIERATGISADRALFDDLISLAARLALDPAQAEAIFEAFEAALEGLGDRLLANVNGDFQPVLDALRGWLQPAIAQIDGFVADLPEVEALDDAVAALAQVAGALAQAAEGLTIQQLRGHLATFIGILENDVGLTPAFLEQQVFAIIDDVVAELEQVPSDIATEARATRRAVVALLRRIKAMLTGRLTPQPLNADRAATTLLETLRRFGWDQFAETGGCLATNLQNVMTLGSTLAGIAGEVTFGDGSLGAAAAPSTDDQYRWYATWLLKTRTRPGYFVLFDWLPFFPPDEVWLDKDNTSLVQRNVFRDDIELHSGTGIDWPDAPLFHKDTTGEHYLVERLPHAFMEGWTFHTAWLVDAAKSVAHMATTENGNIWSHVAHVFWNWLNMFWKLPTEAPFNSWINAGFGGPQGTRWPLDFAWPAAITLLASLEGRHTEADEAKFPFWFILFADDVLEAVTIDAVANLVSDLFLSTFTLLNYDGPVWDNPADDQRPLNKEHVDAWVTLAVYIANQIMISQFPRDRYTYPGDDRRATDKPDQKRLLIGEWWFGWNTLSTLLGVIAGWLVACAWSRTFDLNVLWKQGVKHLIQNLALFLLTLYGRENNTDDGKYNPRGTAFDGYPGHDNSPYKLPYEAGQAEACVQGNQGMWSHNDFAADSQVYAYDFALDQDKIELAARSGTVVDYFDWVPNDQHPENNVQLPNVNLARHLDRINAVDFNHDGTRVATSSHDGTAFVWDAASGEVLRSLNHGGTVFDVAYNHDGTRLATASDNDTAQLWDPATGVQLRDLTSHGDDVLGVAFNHDGTQLATASADDTAIIWSTVTGAVMQTLTGHTDDVTGVAFNHDGTRLATASKDQSLRIWNVADGSELHNLAQGSSVLAVAFNHDGTEVAAALESGEVKVWNPADGSAIRTINTGAVPANDVAYSHDGTKLATASDDDTARTWNAADGSADQTFTGHKDDVLGVAFSHDDSRLATASKDVTARTWNVADGSEVQCFGTHDQPLTSVALNHDASLVATASIDQTVRIWNAATGADLHVLDHPGAVNGVAFSHDGTQLAAGCDNGEVKIWNPSDGTEIRTIAAHGSGVHGVAYNHDGSQLATAGADNTAKLFNPADGSELHTLAGHTSAVRAVAFNHDGTRLATASEDDTAKTWDTAAGTVDQTFSGHGGDILGVAFNHDGTRLATASADDTARTWDTATGTVDQTFSGHGGDVNAVAFSPDGTRLATASSDEKARVWNAADASLLVTFSDHNGPVRSIVYQPTEIQLATASDDRTGRIWWQLLDGQTTAETWNFVLIRHDNPFNGVDPDFDESTEQRNAHDKGPGGGVIQTYGVYGHGRTGSVREILEPCRVAQGLPSIIGVRVKQGTPLMRSGNTGHSFVNHLHMHVQAEPPSTSPATSTNVPFALANLDDYTIPFVFQDVDGDGVPKSLAFYTSGNTRQECT